MIGGSSSELHPNARRALNGVLLALVVAASMFWFWAYREASGLSPERPQPFNDATTYLAAAERLNANHELYALGPGDRPVLIIPGVNDAPLLSPPPIAAFWRLVVAVPFGYELWIVGAWLATFTAVAYVVLRAPFPAAPLALLISLPIGEQVFGANACAFYPLLYILAWKLRDRAWVGLIVAVLAAVKLAPIALVGWLLGTRRYRACAITIASLAVIFVLGGLGAGFGTYFEYLGMIPSIGPSPMSVAGVSGISWASYAVFGGGFFLAVLVGRRWPATSFAIAVLTAIVGTPALYPAHFVSLLGLLAPLTDRPMQVDRESDRARTPTLGWLARSLRVRRVLP